MAIAEKELKAFIALADNLHFARASQLSHLTPSALSRLISRLEEQLSVELFYRDKRSVELTPAGSIFYEYAKQSLLDYKHLNNTFTQYKDSLHGELNMYCSVTAAYSILESILPDFQQKYANVDVHVHTGDTALAIDRVLAGDDDVSITARPKSLNAQLIFKKISHSDVLFISSDKYTETLEASDYSSVPWIISESGFMRDYFDAWQSKNNFELEIYAQVSGHEAIVSMVALGFGVGIVPEIVLNNSPQSKSVKVIDCQPSISGFDIGLCTRKKNMQYEPVKALWDSI